MEYVTIYRFSEDGFIPKKQDYWYNDLSEIKSPSKFLGLNDFQKQLVKITRENNKDKIKALNLNDWKEGVFAFVGKLPSIKYIKFELNHLQKNEIQQRILFTGKLPKGVEVYSLSGSVPLKQKIEEINIQSACYIPKRTLAFLSDVHEENMNYKEITHSN